MGVIGQMPQSPDALPGHAVGTGEPPFTPQAGATSTDGRPSETGHGPRADQLPALGPAQNRMISLPPPQQPGVRADPIGRDEDEGAAS